MKKLLIITALFCVGCAKDKLPDIPGLNAKMNGHYYKLKGDIFSRGQYQPESPLLIRSVYFNQVEQIPYAKAAARVNWSQFDPYTPANKLEVQNGLRYGDTTTHIWNIPVEDLK